MRRWAEDCCSAPLYSQLFSAFTGCAALAWLLAARWRRWRLWLPAGLGFAAFLPADLWFFVAQHASRAGQFPPFRLGSSLARLGVYATANLFGGLPLYVTGSAREFVGDALGAAALGLVALTAWRWRRVGGEEGLLLLLCAAATPLGLLLLGAAFDNTPVELRYLCFATPFAALLLAGALGAGAGARTLRGAVFSIQALALAGLILRPETMQPARAAARAAAALAGFDGVVLLPRGNDGVGVVGPFLAELPDRTRVLLVDADEPPDALRARLPAGSPVVIAWLGLDASSIEELATIRAAFPCATQFQPAGYQLSRSTAAASIVGSPTASARPSPSGRSVWPCQSVSRPPAPSITGTRAAQSQTLRSASAITSIWPSAMSP